MTGRRLYVYVAISVAAVALAAYFLTRNTRQELRADQAATPGFDESGPQDDDRPFEFAGPTTTAGATTIPGGVASPFEETTTTTTTTTLPPFVPTAPPPTTPSTLPPKPLLPHLSSIKSPCGMVDTLQSTANVFFDDRLEPKTVLTSMSKVMHRYSSVSPEEIEADTRVIATLFDRLVSIVEDADWDVSDPSVVESADAIKNQTAPFATLQEHARRVQFWEAANCPTMRSR